MHYTFTLSLFLRFYTSADLADRLLTDFNMTIVGTLTANRKGLPKVPIMEKIEGRAIDHSTGVYISVRKRYLSPPPF
jgi:hypothetical protein